MSYKSRERKRRKKAAIASTKKTFHEETERRYFLTLVKHDCRCAGCGGRLRAGTEMVFRALGPVMLCVVCAEADPLVTFRPSLRWERAQRRSRS